MKSILKTTLAIVLLLGAVLPIAAEEEVLYYESRDDVPLKYQWDITAIFPSVDSFNESYGDLEEILPAMEKFKGRLGESAQTLAGGLEMMNDIMERMGELAVYAGQNRDTDTENAEANDLYNRINGLGARIEQLFAFVEPEISKIPDETLEGYLKEKRVKAYAHYIDDIVRQKEHIRSAEVEEVLASASLLSRAPYEAYSSMVYTDVEWPTITDEEGEEKVVSPALYYSFVSDQNRDIRKSAALALFGKYTEFANTFAATYSGHVQRDIFFARNRGFENSLGAKMFAVNVPIDVIETLKGTVHRNYDKIHKYAELRKEILGVDEFHVYDLYVSMVPEGETKYTYEEGYKLALDFWRKTYGKEYHALCKQAFNDRWIDVCASKGKRGGAYSWGSYNSHPYLLLNWGGTLEDVFTLVHEMGHSIHTYLANKNQPVQYSDYSLFVAEVAAVASEALFMDYMLERAENDDEKLALLNMYIGNITGTFLRQIFFHEFEQNAHEMAEEGAPLTRESLGEMYASLWADYYGPELVLDDEFRAGWSRIPHFYRTYYVWVYATSFAAGEAIAQRVRDHGMSAVDDYIAMLKLGGSVYPLDALKRGGVDMTDPKVIQTVMDRYGETLDKMGALLRARAN